MDPQAVTVGARAGRRMLPIIWIAMQSSPDRVSFCAGLISSIVGGLAGWLGKQTAAELLRISLAQLEERPEIHLPPAVRQALNAAAADEEQPTAANDAAPARQS